MKSIQLLFLVAYLRCDAFTVNPSSFNAYPINNEKAPDELMRAESERIQTRLREHQQQQQLANADSSLTAAVGGADPQYHHTVDMLKFERILVQLAAEYVQDTTELCRQAADESEGEADAILAPRAPSSGAPSMINDKLPAFLKPIPSNSTRPANGLQSSAFLLDAADAESSFSAGAAASFSSSDPKRVGKRQRVSRFLSALVGNPFRAKKHQPAETDESTSSDAATGNSVVDMDDCTSWA